LKRKTKRLWQKRWIAFCAPLGILGTFLGLFDSLIQEAIVPLIKLLFSLKDNSILPLPILFCFVLIIIAILSYLVSEFYLLINSPNSKYFGLIDFEKPTDDVIKKAVEGILNSEKTKPYFVHAAPINDEIVQFYEKLDNDCFVWENGKPGVGKSMLAYHALYRFRKTVGFTYRYIPVKLFKLKYKVYQLDLTKITDEKDIPSILDELYSLKGGSRIITLVDDAHKLNFEEKLRSEFEVEAKERISGKFVWINTNYLDANNSDSTDAFNIDFEKFYPKLIEGLYKSQNPIVKEIIKNKCTSLQDAIKLKGRIKDPWHFNFVASNGEQRVIQLLQQLSSKKEERDILLLSIFLFSVRNIISGEKEINQTEFANLLSNIDTPYFKNNIEKYEPNKIISDLGSQEKGRFIIIEDEDSLNRGYLLAPHARLSKAVIITIIKEIKDENLIKNIINASKLLLTNDFGDSKYLIIYFDLLGKYQEYFLNTNKVWITNFLTNLLLDQLHVYPSLIAILKKHHNSFYKEIITDEYFVTITAVISSAPANKFTAIQSFIQVLGNDKEKLVQKLNWETLANAANKAEVAQLKQVADFINALGNDKEKLSVFFEKENIIEYFKNASWKEITPLCIILASISTETQNSLISKCNWIEVLNKINLNHSVQVKSLSYILYYQNKKQAILKLSIANEETTVYLETNREKVIRFCTQYFISPDDFQSCSNLLNVLIPHSKDICQSITNKIKYKITRDFSITPQYYQSFSNLLNTINQINPLISKYIIKDNLVKSKLLTSFQDNSIHDQVNGIESLLNAIKNIDVLLTEEILALQSIKVLKLDGIENNQTNETINGI